MACWLLLVKQSLVLWLLRMCVLFFPVFLPEILLCWVAEARIRLAGLKDQALAERLALILRKMLRSAAVSGFSSVSLEDGIIRQLGHVFFFSKLKPDNQ